MNKEISNLEGRICQKRKHNQRKPQKSGKEAVEDGQAKQRLWRIDKK